MIKIMSKATGIAFIMATQVGRLIHCGETSQSISMPVNTVRTGTTGTIVLTKKDAIGETSAVSVGADGYLDSGTVEIPEKLDRAGGKSYNRLGPIQIPKGY